MSNSDCGHTVYGKKDYFIWKIDYIQHLHLHRDRKKKKKTPLRCVFVRVAKVQDRPHLQPWHTCQKYTFPSKCLDWGGEVTIASLWLDPSEAPQQRDNGWVYSHCLFERVWVREPPCILRSPAVGPPCTADYISAHQKSHCWTKLLISISINTEMSAAQ